MTLNFALLAAFIPTFLFVSFTPGMCMTLSMTLGMTVGLKRTLWMMAGELIGVGLVATAAVMGVAAIMLGAPWAFTIFKWVGGLYLGWLGLQMWRSKGKMALPETGGGQSTGLIQRKALFVQGFVTAVANPKGWAFLTVLLPPFIDESLPLAPQLWVLVMLILFMEWLALLCYASGGHALNRLLHSPKNVRMINRLAGVLMMGVGLWLALG